MNDPYQPVQRSSFTCSSCGFDLSGSAVGGYCPECGKPVSESLRTSSHNGGSSSTATTSMVLGILGLVVCGLCGPFAIWLYYKAKDEVERGIAPPSSMGMAKAGLIMGWIAVAFMILGCVFYALILGTASM